MAKSGKAEKWAARGARLSAALRENLKRRKAQARGRAACAPLECEQGATPGAKPDADAPDFRRNRGNE